MRSNADHISFRTDAASRLPQFRHDGRNMRRHSVAKRNFAAGDGRRAKQSTRHDAIRDHAVRNAIPLQRAALWHMVSTAAAARDADGGRARTRNAIAKFAQEGLKVLNLRLPRSVLNHRFPFRPHSRHHNVFRGADARIVQMDVSAGHGVSIAKDEPMFFTDPDAQHGESAQMQVNWPVADLTPARERAYRMPKAGKQRPQHEDGRTQLFGKPLRHNIRICGGGVQQELLIVPSPTNAERAQNRQHVLHVPEPRAVIQCNRPF